MSQHSNSKTEYRALWIKCCPQNKQTTKIDEEDRWQMKDDYMFMQNLPVHIKP